MINYCSNVLYYCSSAALSPRIEHSWHTSIMGRRISVFHRHSRSSSSNRSARSSTSATSNLTQLQYWHNQHSLVSPLPDLQPVPLSIMPTMHCDDEQHAGPSLRMPKLHASVWQNVVIDKPLNCHGCTFFWRTVVIDKPSNCR